MFSKHHCKWETTERKTRRKSPLLRHLANRATFDVARTNTAVPGGGKIQEFSSHSENQTSNEIMKDANNRIIRGKFTTMQKFHLNTLLLWPQFSCDFHVHLSLAWFSSEDPFVAGLGDGKRTQLYDAKTLMDTEQIFVTHCLAWRGQELEKFKPADFLFRIWNCVSCYAWKLVSNWIFPLKMMGKWTVNGSG